MTPLGVCTCSQLRDMGSFAKESTQARKGVVSHSDAHHPGSASHPPNN